MKIIIDTNLWISFMLGRKLRDKKDLYLLSLADTIKANYIVTGDKDLLVLEKHNHTKIVTITEFMKLL